MHAVPTLYHHDFDLTSIDAVLRLY
jgi:hypothetical protein